MSEPAKDEILQILVACVEKVTRKKANDLHIDTQLIDDGILDSLDAMAFLFEFETRLGSKLDAIDEDFDDFRVGRLVEIARKAN